ncbi:MAG: HD domain-containing protein, partial [Lachnospiraceae bacterium]|nr:HD domain-containing protein [Lachnospiraceae bacterium]
IAGVLAGGRAGVRYLLWTLAIDLGLNLVDKGITAGASALILYLIPNDKEKVLWDSDWKQKPLSASEIRGINRAAGKSRYSLRTRMTIMLIMTAVVLTAVMTVISANLHFERTKEEYTQNAIHAARFAASLIDPESVNTILREGKDAEGYRETEQMLYRIRENSSGVKFLYVLRIEEDGGRFLYDLDTEEEEGWMPGDFTPFEKAFEPYLKDLKEGREIEPIVSDDAFGWLLTAYVPVRNAQGKTVCYAGADVSMRYLSDYLMDYLLRILLIFSGFFLLVLSYGLWVSGYTLIYPTGSMAASVEGLIRAGDDQAVLDENVRALKALDIHTGDETEKLYAALCQMAGETAEQMRELRHYAEATAQMQNGLIMTMADMVENRDSDTGAHVQKTAAYVRIILEGLKCKGYYERKLTRKYMNDVIMSAPLHDVGKIRIPDAVLNKPGKLTEEEYAIMKTHTTAGKEIMEKAIETVQGGSYLKEARNMAAYHHERWDGKGYPEGLKGEVIPLSARVMAIADVFDALASPRVYKPAFPFEKAVGIIEEGAGAQFDPKCVEVFLEALPQVQQVLRKYHGAES